MVSHRWRQTHRVLQTYYLVEVFRKLQENKEKIKAEFHHHLARIKTLLPYENIFLFRNWR